MKVKVKRKQVVDSIATIGDIYIDSVFFGATLENAPQKIKMPKITRIPSGTYRLKLKDVVTPLTELYRKKYDWFSYHLEIQDVPDFTNCYIHIGNRAEDTDACILVGSSQEYGKAFIGNSTTALRRFYETVVPVIQSGEYVYITIEDEVS